MNKRPQQILHDFSNLIDEHLNDLVNQRATEMFEIEAFADKLFIHPTHLSNTIKDLTGGSPCAIYQLKILETAERLLAGDRTIKAIALCLDFEPSQFSKWFRRLKGLTPKAYRFEILKS